MFSLIAPLIVRSDKIFFGDPDYVADHDFMLKLTDFIEFLTILGAFYWKTVVSNEELSIIQASRNIIQKLIDAFMNKDNNDIELLKSDKRYTYLQQMVKNFDYSMDRPLITSTVYPQERFHQRRYSFC